jgi:ABC-type nitrate/sulfonate/bicarbonate transport system substrate-binding protein
MNPRKLFPPAQHSPIHWFCFAVCLLQLLLIGNEVEGQSKLTPVRTAYSALSAGIGTLWLTHEDGHFRKHGLDSNLIYIRGGSTAVQALLAGEIQFGHLSPAPMLTAWIQGADFVWIGTTTHQMVFTLLADPAIAKGADLKGKKIGITRIGSASDLAVRTALEQFSVIFKDVPMERLSTKTPEDK